MYSISFIFKPRTYDDELHHLDAATEAVANGTAGTVAATPVADREAARAAIDSLRIINQGTATWSPAGS